MRGGGGATIVSGWLWRPPPLVAPLFILSHLIKFITSDCVYHVSVLIELRQILRGEIHEELCVMIAQKHKVQS